MKQLLFRLKSAVPAFWKKVQRICLAAGTAAASVFGYTYLAQLPNWLVEAAKIGAAMGFFGAFLAQLTIRDKNEGEADAK